MYPVRTRTLSAFVLAAALTVGVGGAIASSQSSAYGSAALIQAGHGPGGPPATVLSRLPQASGAATRHDYGSAAIVQLGHGPGGPHQPSES